MHSEKLLLKIKFSTLTHKVKIG